MISRSTKFNLKNIIISLMVCVLILCGSFAGYHFYPSQVLANYQKEEALIVNGSFTQTSSSKTPETPNNWILKNPQSNELLKAGVITTFPTDFDGKKEEYELTTNPGQPDDEDKSGLTSSSAFYRQLMINSPEDESGAATVAYAGYESQSFTLEANSFYSFTVKLKTINSASASIYIEGLSNKDVAAYLENISTYGSWKTYQIFIRTSSFASENPLFSVWLGTKDGSASPGAVFVHSVTARRYSESTFYTAWGNDTSDANSNKVMADLSRPLMADPVINSNFENSYLPSSVENHSSVVPGWKMLQGTNNPEVQKTKIISTAGGYNAAIDTDESIPNPGTNFSERNRNNSNVLFMYNKNADLYQGLQSSDIIIKQHKFYRLSVWAKSTANVGSGATIKLEQKNPNPDDEEFVPVSAAPISVSTNEGTNLPANNWVKHSFYIQGHPLYEEVIVNLQLWLGTAEAPTNGYVFFSSVEMEEISYANYESGSANGSKLSFHNSDNPFIINNGNFNQTQTDKVEVTYPLTPASWELSTSDKTFNIDQSLSGVVNTKTSLFNQYKSEINTIAGRQITVSNPGIIGTIGREDEISNNILVLGNPVTTTQSYTSTEFSLEADKYYEISFNLKTQFAQTVADSGFLTRLTANDAKIFEAVRMISADNWTKFSINIATKSAITCKLEFSLYNIEGFAFIDNVEVASLASEEAFTEITTNEGLNNIDRRCQTVYKVNLAKESFELVSHNQNQAVQTSFNWTGNDYSPTNSGAQFGILNVNHPDYSFHFPSVSNPGSITGSNVMFIRSMEDAFYTATCSEPLQLNSETWYKISVWVKTMYLSQEDANQETVYNPTTEQDEAVPFGAQINLTVPGTNSAFTGINTQTEGNGWIEYSYYVQGSDSSVQLELSLGSSNGLTSGFVFFDAINVTELTEGEYTSQVNALQNFRFNRVLTTPENSGSEDGEDDFVNKFDWYTIPSIITAIALLLALVGTLIRQTPSRQRPKIKTMYDRRKTLEVEMDRRERIELRQNIVSELKAEYNEIEKELNAINKLYEAEEKKAKASIEAKIKEHEKLKHAIIVEKQKVVSLHKEQLANLAPENKVERTKLIKEYDSTLKRLNEQEMAEQRIISGSDKAVETLRNKFINETRPLTAKQTFILEEIQRIELEIEEIAREEEVMWSEYKRAKEEAKQQKLVYMQEKRKTTRKPSKKAEATNTETNEAEKTEATSETTEDTTGVVDTVDTATNAPANTAEETAETTTEATQVSEATETVETETTASQDEPEKKDE